MSNYHASSSCSCPRSHGSVGSRSHGSVGSHPTSESQGWAPDCGCRQKAVVRTATTKLNYGRKFRGCKNFKPNNPGCNFFDWYYEGVTNEKDQMIMSQRDKLGDLRNKVNELKSNVNELQWKLDEATSCSLNVDQMNNVNELRQKLDEAISSINAQNHILEAQCRKIASLEIALSNSKKWTKIGGISFVILLMALFCALGDKGRAIASPRFQLN